MSLKLHFSDVFYFPNSNDPESPKDMKEWLARIKHGSGIDHTLATSAEAIDKIYKSKGGLKRPRVGY